MEMREYSYCAAVDKSQSLHVTWQHTGTVTQFHIHFLFTFCPIKFLVEKCCQLCKKKKIWINFGRFFRKCLNGTNNNVQSRKYLSFARFYFRMTVCRNARAIIFFVHLLSFQPNNTYKIKQQTSFFLLFEIVVDGWKFTLVFWYYRAKGRYFQLKIRLIACQ